MQLGMLWYLGLNEDRRLRRVNAGSQPVDHHVPGTSLDDRRVVDVVDVVDDLSSGSLANLANARTAPDRRFSFHRLDVTSPGLADLLAQRRPEVVFHLAGEPVAEGRWTDDKRRRIRDSRVLGTRQGTILIRHILPNLFHLVLISVAMDFSSLVLAEAVLTYVSIGVDPTTYSWGNMINSARLEMAREPVVWWPLASAFAFMFILVLSANIFADALRDALDPHRQTGG